MIVPHTKEFLQNIVYFIYLLLTIKKRGEKIQEVTHAMGQYPKDLRSQGTKKSQLVLSQKFTPSPIQSVSFKSEVVKFLRNGFPTLPWS